MIVYDSPQHELHRPSLPQCWLSKPDSFWPLGAAPRGWVEKRIGAQEPWTWLGSHQVTQMGPPVFLRCTTNPWKPRITWRSRSDFPADPPSGEQPRLQTFPVGNASAAWTKRCHRVSFSTPTVIVGFKWKPSGNHWIIAESDVTFSLEQLPKEMSDLFVALLCNKPMRSTLASRIEKRNSSTETSLEDLKHQLEILSAQQQSVPESESGTGGVGVRSISQEVRGTWCPQLYFRHLIQLRILKTFKT